MIKGYIELFNKITFSNKIINIIKTLLQFFLINKMRYEQVVISPPSLHNLWYKFFPVGSKAFRGTENKTVV